MDLASAPAIAKPAPSPSRPEASSVRMLSPAQASEPGFVREWMTLVSRASEPNPFLEPWFLLPSLAQFAGGNQCLVFAFYQDGRLTGLLPLNSARSYYGYPVPHIANWLHDNAFCGLPLVAEGQERAFWRALFAQLDSRSDSAPFLHLAQLPVQGALSEALDAVLAEGERRCVTVEKTERAMLATDLDAEAYLARAMSSKKRKELRRQHKRLAEKGDLHVERIESNEGIAAWIDEFLALEASGWKGGAGSALASAPATRAFFAEALSGAAQDGRLERLALRLDGKPVAMLANFLSPPGVFSFKTAFDEAYSRYSPGLLLQIENLQLLARHDVEWADSCAAEGHSMIERIWREKRAFASRNIAIGGPLRRAAFRLLMAYETRNRSAA